MKLDAEPSKHSNQQKGYGLRRFVVTVAVMSAQTGAFQTCSFLQTCDAGDRPTASSAHATWGRSRSPPHGKKDAKELKNLIQRNISGTDKGRLIIFRAGRLPSQNGPAATDVDSEIKFFHDFAEGGGLSSAYYSTSSSSSARLDSLVPAAEVAHTTLVVPPDYADSKKWLVRKKTLSGPPVGPISLTLHCGEKADQDFLGHDSAVFNPLWSSPPGVWSSKDLGLVAVARKATRKPW